MISITKNIGLNKLLDEIHSFPMSLDISVTKYNTGKLIGILQEKEVIDICKVTKEDFDYANSIDLELGGVINKLFKEKDHSNAYSDYLALEKKIESTTTGNLFLYIKQGALSVKALYHYKNGEYEYAKNLTLECIVLNEYLIEQGIGTLNLRCFEQNKNISRILLRANKTEEGHDLLNNLLTYLLSGKEKNLFGNLFKDKNYWNKVPILRETYAYELFPMIAEDMIRFNIQDKLNYLPNEWYLNLDFDVNTSERQIIYNWIYINNQLQKGDYDEYIDSLIYFFQQPMSLFYDVLKISLLIDLVKVIKKEYFVDAEVTINKLKDYLFNKLIYNLKFRELVSKNLFQL